MSGSGWVRRSLLFAWELPQNLLGAAQLGIVLVRKRARRIRFDRERVMVEVDGAPAVSLGLFVFWSRVDTPYVPVGPENEAHEFGHSIQSRWLGPLYLPVVGAPSTVRASYAVGYRWITGRRWSRYYDGFPERWADELGGADLSLRPAP